MKKYLFLFLVIAATGIFATPKKITPQQLKIYGPINIYKPVMLDNTDLKGKKYSDENLLSTDINVPEQEKFTKAIRPDAEGWFRLEKPVSEKVFYLVSFYVSGNRYGKGKLTVKSPDRFEIYVNDKKEASKATVEDTLKNAKSADANLKGNVNGAHVVLKYLASSVSKVAPMFQLSIGPEKDDTTYSYAVNDQPRRRMTIQDVLVGKRVSSAAVSPSGRFVLMKFYFTNDDGKTEYTTEIYDTKLRRTVLSEKDNRNQLGWMPKSDKLFYFSNADNGYNMYTLDPISSETKLLAENVPYQNFRISPDEKTLYYSKMDTLNVKSPSGLSRIVSPEDRQSYYRKRYSIYQYQLATGISQQITFGKNTASVRDISSDGKYLLFSVSEEDYATRPFSKTSFYRLNLENMDLETLWKEQRFINDVEFSPDGKNLLITGSAESFDGVGLNIPSGEMSNSYDIQAFIMDLNTKKIDPITKDFNPSVGDVWWNETDNKIYLKVEDKDRVNIYRYDINAKIFEKLPLKEDLIKSFSLSKYALNAVYIGSGVQNSARAYLLNLKNMQSEMIADPYKDRLAKLDLGEVKDWSFTSKNGDVIDGRYYLPPHFDPLKKYPAIVYYYGGTSPTQRTFESTYPLNVYAAMDYVVYTLNPSGTTGYGQEFAARHVNAWGKRTADEIIEGTKKFIADHSYVDGAKVGCIGASYGGFMTQYLLTQTDVFAAGVSHAGISALSSYWGEGYWGYTYSAGASAGSYPWNNWKLYTEQSPLFNADKIKTPLLLLHGTEDTNVPPGESIQMFTALKLLGQPVELVMVQGENHVILNFKKRIAWNETIYAWFSKWLKNDSAWWNDLYGE